MSTYSPSLRAELITNGTQAGTWGGTTNDNFSTVFDAAIAGYITVTAASANQALTYVNGPTSTASANESVRAALNLTTSTGADFAVYAPPVSKLYVIKNSSAYTATIYNSTVIGNTTAAGTGVAIPAGKTMAVWSDGTNLTQQTNHLISPTLASPAMSGTPTAPTATPGTNTTQVATTGFVATSYAPLASPALTGTPTAPTASPGTNTTQLATTAFVTAALQAAYPVGSIYMNANNATSPATLLGFGTWVSFGAGRMPVGFSSGDPLFGTAGNTGGSRDATLPSHTHSISASQSSHTHYIANTDEGPSWASYPASNLDVNNYLTRGRGQGSGGTAENYALYADGTVANVGLTNSATPSISASASTAGSSATNANLPPYITVYMWQRTA